MWEKIIQPHVPGTNELMKCRPFGLSLTVISAIPPISDPPPQCIITTAKPHKPANPQWSSLSKKRRLAIIAVIMIPTVAIIYTIKNLKLKSTRIRIHFSDLWYHNPNLVKIWPALVWKIMIWSDHHSAYHESRSTIRICKFAISYIVSYIALVECQGRN